MLELSCRSFVYEAKVDTTTLTILYLQGDAPKPMMTVLNFAVVGASGAGKSTFIKCALDLSKPATSPSSTKKMSLEGELFRITLMEIQLDDLTIRKDQDIEWPENLGTKLMPKVDGVLAVYDVADRNSLSAIPALMSEYTRHGFF